MTSDFKFLKQEIKNYFSHYKEFIIPAVVILICLILVFLVLIPQIQTIFSEREQTNITQEHIKTLQDNISVISALPDQALDENTRVVFKALSKDKDFSAILYAIKTISARTGTPIGDFNFAVGDLSPKNQRLQNKITLPLQLYLQSTSFEQANKFISELSKALPLSEIERVAMSTGGTTVIINYYYRPIKSLSVEQTSPLAPFIQNNQPLLKQLKDWEKNTSEGDFLSGNERVTLPTPTP